MRKTWVFWRQDDWICLQEPWRGRTINLRRPDGVWKQMGMNKIGKWSAGTPTSRCSSMFPCSLIWEPATRRKLKLSWTRTTTLSSALLRRCLNLALAHPAKNHPWICYIRIETSEITNTQIDIYDFLFSHTLSHETSSIMNRPMALLLRHSSPPCFWEPLRIAFLDGAPFQP